MAWIAIAGIATLLSFALGKVAYKVLKNFGIVDRPNERSSHQTPTVRGGGVSFITILVAFGCFLAVYRSEAELAILMGVVLLVAIVSMVDDLKSLSAAVRLGTHLVGALGALLVLRPWVMAMGLSPEWLWVPSSLWAWMGALLWIAGYTNAFNFMDGINGISAFQATITAFGMALLAGVGSNIWNSTPQLLLMALVGAVLGFLPHNFPKARMFMGDVGSAALGFLLAVLALWIANVHGPWLLVPLILLHANYLLDTGFTLARRIARGEKWYAPHREHFYQRYVRAGRSHQWVTLRETLLQIVTLGLMLAYVSTDSLVLRSLTVGLVFAFWGFFYWRAETEFQVIGGLEKSC